MLTHLTTEFQLLDIRAKGLDHTQAFLQRVFRDILNFSSRVVCSKKGTLAGSRWYGDRVEFFSLVWLCAVLRSVMVESAGFRKRLKRSVSPTTRIIQLVEHSPQGLRQSRA